MQVDLFIENSVAMLTLCNPEKLNALSASFVEMIYEKLVDIESKAKVLVIFGTEKAFAAGVDINEFAKLDYEKATLNDFINYKWERVLNTKIPVIAAVQGYALGAGFELALASDIIIAADSSVFGFPEINFGLIPGLGGTQLLSRLVGVKKASELIMTGDYISAKEALSLGIVSKIVEKESLKDAAIALAQKIAKKSDVGLRLAKEAIRLSQNAPLSQGICTERTMFRSLFSTQAKIEGVSRFLKK